MDNLARTDLLCRKNVGTQWVMVSYLKNKSVLARGLIKVDLEFSFSIPGLFQTWNSNKPGFENLNSRFEPVFEKLNSRSELALRKKTQ